MPKMQRSFAPRLQGVGHAQVSTHVPLEQTCPLGHVTPVQGFRVHVPPTQTSPVAHETLSHGDGGTQSTLHAKPSGHCASQRARGSHMPVEREQNCPSGHTTPEHGAG